MSLKTLKREKRENTNTKHNLNKFRKEMYMFKKGDNKYQSTGRTSEELMAARAKREAIIKKALDDGALLHKTNSSLTEDERETLIRLDYLTGQAFVDSSIPADITKFINRGWKITSVTKSGKDNTVQAMTFVGPAKKISVGSLTGQSEDKEDKEE